MTTEQQKHLEFIQNAITRCNNNSFQIKGITITIISAMLAIYASNSKPLIILMAIPSSILFWFLDAYYLQLERKLRAVYDDVIGVKARVAVKPFEFPISKYKDQDSSFNYLNCLFANTVFPIYLFANALLVLLYIYLTNK